MMYKVWHKSHKKWIHDETDVFIAPDGDVWEKYDISYETAMQNITNYVDTVRFTGLQDKHSKDVYEGDTLRLTDYHGVRIVHVWYSDNYGVFFYGGDGFSDEYLFNSSNREIIGNIYEGSEKE